MGLGTGWIGWTVAETLATDMAHILIAHRGRVDLLQQIFGGKKAEREEPEWQGSAPGTLTNILKRFGKR